MRREFSAGGVVYKKEGNKVWWLVRRPKMTKGYRGNPGWGFPKGWIDKGETVEEAALREVREEGGVEAKIIAKLPTFKIWFKDQNGENVMKFITYFVMEFVEEFQGDWGDETEEVKWAKGDEMREMLTFKNERELFVMAEEKVNE